MHVSPVLQPYILLVNENGSVSLVTTDLARVIAKGEPIKRYDRGRMVEQSMYGVTCSL